MWSSVAKCLRIYEAVLACSGCSVVDVDGGSGDGCCVGRVPWAFKGGLGYEEGVPVGVGGGVGRFPGARSDCAGVCESGLVEEAGQVE